MWREREGEKKRKKKKKSSSMIIILLFSLTNKKEKKKDNVSGNALSREWNKNYLREAKKIYI